MARIYVGTYAKYNSGSIEGAWIDLEDFAGDKDGFYAKCAELHKDEADPEFMFQDFEEFPREFYGESSLQDGLWEWLELDEDDREMLAAYCSARGDGQTIEAANDAFQGTADSERDFAENLFEELGYLGDSNPLRNYVDWDAVVRDLKMDYSFERADNGKLYVFRD